MSRFQEPPQQNMMQDGLTPRSQGFMPQGGFANPYQAQGMRALQGSGLMSSGQPSSFQQAPQPQPNFQQAQMSQQPHSQQPSMEQQAMKAMGGLGYPMPTPPQAAGSGLGANAMMSDRRNKGDIVRTFPGDSGPDDGAFFDSRINKQNPIDAFNKALADSAATYRYSNPAQEPRSTPTGGKYAGIMAQALEKVPEIGPQLVSNTPRGKAIETQAVQSAQLAGQGRQQQQLDAITQKLSALDASNQAYKAKSKDPSLYDAFASSKPAQRTWGGSPDTPAAAAPPDQYADLMNGLKPEEQALLKSMLARGGQ
jgi:hypothetical protein